MTGFDELEHRLGELGAFIRSQRHLAEMSVRRLSELSGISNPYLSQIERGLRKPSADILQQIAKGLQISAEQLYVRAGILDADGLAPHPAPGVSEAIRLDPNLTESQKQSLLRVYDAFRAEAAAESAGRRRR
jgi:transcriptional regulator with XRE-family HTH domain